MMKPIYKLFPSVVHYLTNPVKLIVSSLIKKFGIEASHFLVTPPLYFVDMNSNLKSKKKWENCLLP